MRKIITICIIGLFALNVQPQPVKTLKLSDKELLDKIKGILNVRPSSDRVSVFS